MTQGQASKEKMEEGEIVHGSRVGWKRGFVTIDGKMTSKEHAKLVRELEAMTGDGIYFILRSTVVT